MATPNSFSFKAGVLAALPIVPGYVSIGLACGVIERSAGLSILEIFLLGLLLYAGGAQFVVAGMVGAGASASTIVPTIGFLNLRHLLYATALAPSLKRLKLWQSLTIGYGLTDEAFAVDSNAWIGKEAQSPRWFWGLHITAQASWILATVLGGLMGSLVADLTALGLDFALPAMFLGLLALGLQGRPKPGIGWVTAGLGGAAAVGLSLVISGTLPVVIAAVGAAILGALLEWRAERLAVSAPPNASEPASPERGATEC